MARALPTGWAGRLLALILLLAVAAVLWLGVAAPLIEFYRDRAETLAERRALADKMATVAATLPKFKETAATPANDSRSPDLLLAGDSDALAAAQLQENLEQAASAAGVVLLSAEGVPTQEIGGLRRVGLKLSLSGKYSALIDFLARVGGAAAPLLVDDLAIQGSPVPDDSDAPLLVGLAIYGFRAGAKS
jgi:general secretion pathway protein M